MKLEARFAGIAAIAGLTGVAVVLLSMRSRSGDFIPSWTGTPVVPPGASTGLLASHAGTERSEREAHALEGLQERVFHALESPLRSVEVASRTSTIEEELAFHVREALSAKLYVNDVVQYMTELAELGVNGRPDLEYEDEDALAYALEGLPASMDGHMLVGTKSYEENGKTFNYVQMNLNIAADGDELVEGVIRQAANVNLSISYDVEDPLRPSRFALMLQQPVDIAGCRDLGIDAYHGVFTQGAYYWHDILNSNPPEALTTTIGIVDGKHVSYSEFPGVSPLIGDIRLVPELLDNLLRQLQRNLKSTRESR